MHWLVWDLQSCLTLFSASRFDNNGWMSEVEREKERERERERERKRERERERKEEREGEIGTRKRRQSEWKG